jgi:hypothetical protein
VKEVKTMPEGWLTVDFPVIGSCITFGHHRQDAPMRKT